jgi:pyrimidine-nucleoside phosphorylase
MRMYDLIQKKQHGHALNKDDISYFVRGVTDATIPLEEISAFLMAIFFVGMDDRELSDLTWNMAHSGNTINLSQIKGIKIDKHSTGGVGDKTTLIVAPIVASCGVPVAKMSGKGLGFTGGTIDKLEAIPGVRTKITIEEFIQNVKNIGICIAGQTESLAPADKILYSLRDKTATVESIPLIAASIMSKKIASGADKIVLDVKVGNGAFMKSIDDALLLAQKMVAIGKNVNRQTMALLTDMSTPLGLAIGNSLEVKEAVRVLNGKGPDDLTILCIEVAANMLHLCQKGSLDACRQIAKEAIKNETALNNLLELVSAQGGDIAFIKNPDCLVSALHAIPVYSS